ncbi:DEAD/DEAH box RNA helicase [Microthyrium microscopicum]|uniref:RNA helicase n=1 Tax=Microthyrium microscopicum TaxID=703497 RepID=A0A6A6UR96_9PEZI|nr:DEAD/DEAH box RNA helicase [Microthyrium microscopicum]
MSDAGFDSGPQVANDNMSEAPIDDEIYAAAYAAEKENFATYEFLDEYGDVPPHDEELRRSLFEKLAETLTLEGEHMEVLNTLNVQIEGRGSVPPIKSFEDAGLHPVMLENLYLCGYKRPSPIQQAVIPAILNDNEVLACAQTGTGKTAAFLIPILSKLMGKFKEVAAPRPGLGLPTGVICRAEPLIVIITPTRELALQIFDHARRLCYRTMLRPVCIFGGGYKDGEYGQDAQLNKGCDILIATPGRLIDYLNRPQFISMRRLKYAVLDEADELLSGDWEDPITRILFGGDANLDCDRKLFLCSATFPEDALITAEEYLGRDFNMITIGRMSSTHSNIEHNIMEIDFRDKRDRVYELLSEQVNVKRTVIFCNTKVECDRLDDFLYNKQLPVICTHSGRPQLDRESAMKMFREGEKAILITTAVFARGMDVRDVTQVINYDMPSAAQGGINEFVHRIGRTARMGNVGHAISFFTDRNEDIAEDLVKLLREVGQPVPGFLEILVEGPGAVENGDAGEGIEGLDDAFGEPNGNVTVEDDAFGAPAPQANDDSW